ARAAVRLWIASERCRHRETRCSETRPISVHIASCRQPESHPSNAFPSAAAAALSGRPFFRISPRREFWRAFSVQHRPGDRNVSQLPPVGGAAQHQPAATHVAATDEIGRKAQSLFKVFEKDIHIFARRDASKENDV